MVEPDNPDLQNRKWASFTIAGEVSTPRRLLNGPHCGPLHERAKKAMKALLPHHHASISAKLMTVLNQHHHDGTANFEQNVCVLDWYVKNTPRRWRPAPTA